MSGFSLEPTNDMENDLVGDEDVPRQAQGSELVSSSSKWHKNTVKTLAMLKRNMGSDSAEGDEEKAPNLSYDKLSHGCSRRTAVGVFFELLQLKTWDFWNLNRMRAMATSWLLQEAALTRSFRQPDDFL
jgi:hypothetical protein